MEYGIGEQHYQNYGGHLTSVLPKEKEDLILDEMRSIHFEVLLKNRKLRKFLASVVSDGNRFWGKQLP